MMKMLMMVAVLRKSRGLILLIAPGLSIPMEDDDS